MATLAEKLATIEENVPKVYDAGYQKGKSEGGGYYDIFWDTFQLNGTRTNYENAFYSMATNEVHWSEATIKPKYDFKISNANSMFRNVVDITEMDKLLENCGVSIEFLPGASAGRMFQECKNLVSVPTINLLNVTNTVLNMFLYCQSLQKVRIENIQSVTMYQGMFSYCTGLVDLEITGELRLTGFDVSQSTLLSHESLLNILNILEDKTTDTSGTNWKVTLGSTNLAKLTEEELEIAYQKGWDVV